jgi:peptidoglycan/LPS O-acetylase OafA/YrhL
LAILGKIVGMGMERKDPAEYLDVLRGLSAYVVLFYHTYQILFQRLTSVDHPLTLPFDIAGHYAVVIFFLLSGYLITGSIRSNIARNGRFDVIDYLAARIARIYPPLIGALIICAAVWGVIVLFDLPGRVAHGAPTDLWQVQRYYGFEWSEFFTALLMYYGLYIADRPLWTLYIEFQMYIAAIGVAIWFGQNRFRGSWSVVAFVALFLAMKQHLWAATWLMGSVANLSPFGRTTAKRIAIVLLPLIVLVAIFDPRLLIFSKRSDVMQLVVCLFFCCVIFFVPPYWKYPTWLVRSANHSYSLYVIHWPLLLLALSLTQDWMGSSPWRTLAAGAGAALAISLFSARFAAVLEQHAYFKKRMLALMARFRLRWRELLDSAGRAEAHDAERVND